MFNSEKSKAKKEMKGFIKEINKDFDAVIMAYELSMDHGNNMLKTCMMKWNEMLATNEG